MTNRALPILDHASTLADLTRCRILQLLGRHELTVSELCTVLQLPQSTVSRHLRVLADGGWVQARKQGTSHLYRLQPEQLEPAARRLWGLIREHLDGTAVEAQDGRRLAAVLRARRSRSEAFFSSTADRWDKLRDELFGRRFDLWALLGLLAHDQVVGDLACGTGQVAAALAPFVRRVVAVDGSAAMLDAARARLAGHDNVALRAGDLEQLPLDDGALDVATLFLALHHVPEPAPALAEIRRVTRPGGRLLVVDMAPHDREEFRHEMGHVWLGFSASDMQRDLAAAGFGAVRYQPLPADPEAKGPSLFVVTATAAPVATAAAADPESVLRQPSTDRTHVHQETAS